MLWRCKRCKALFAVGLSMCPQCTAVSVEHAEEAKDMPKTTRHGGASSAGSSSETSTPKPQNSLEPNSPTPRKRARTTAPRSSSTPGSGDAASTATSGRETDAGEAAG